MTSEREPDLLDRLFDRIDMVKRIGKLSDPAARIALFRMVEGDSLPEALHYAEAPQKCSFHGPPGADDPGRRDT